MYKLKEITEYMMTRDVKLENLDTGEIEECFDDSAVSGEGDFYFMNIDGVYDCKIKLFGEPSYKEENRCVLCKVLNREVRIGKQMLVEVQVNGNKYYIEPNIVSDFLDCDSFNFDYTRKDLIQVDDVIHGDYL